MNDIATRLYDENARLKDEIERLRSEVTNLEFKAFNPDINAFEVFKEELFNWGNKGQFKNVASKAEDLIRQLQMIEAKFDSLEKVYFRKVEDDMKGIEKI